MSTQTFFSKYKCLKENATNMGIYNLQYYFIYRCLRQKGRFSVHKNKEWIHLQQQKIYCTSIKKNRKKSQ